MSGDEHRNVRVDGSGRGHAKVILFGEHAVVHGRTAIAAALDRGARATAAEAEGAEKSTLSLDPWKRTASTDDASDEVGQAFAALLAALDVREPLTAHVSVDVPGGAGLGCSAAIGVALARAVARTVGRPIDDEQAAACADAWERTFHGNPSGVDAAIAARGGVIVFRKGTPPRPVYPGAPMEMAVAYTGEPSSTRTMVEQVARQLARRPQVVERTFDGIDALALKAVSSIEAARWYEVGRLMDLNHALLASLMVSTEALEKACNVARGAGALGAKLTGGGGGGCAIALCPDKTDAVLEAWRREGIQGFAAKIVPAVPIVGAGASA